MVNQTVVQIIGDRILNGGLNPKTNQPFQLGDIINADYKTAIENYLIEKSGALNASTSTPGTTTTAAS